MADGKLRALDPTLYPIESLEDAFYQDNQFVERFYELITKFIEPPFAISVDGLWGSGKTTLMKLLQRKLHEDGENGYSTFWFNPWEYRKTESVVLAFLQSLALHHRDAADELIRQGYTLFKVLLEQGILAGLDFLKIGKTVNEIRKEFSEAEKKQKKTFETYIDSIKLVKNEFKALIDAIGKKYFNKTIIIFFDDLDRCLPEDAIQLLEAVKNLFVTQECKVIFICGIDTGVAKKFIESHYKGLEENFAINYFRKIFNLTVSIPSLAPIHTLLSGYIRQLFGWENAEAEKLASMIYTCGLQAEIASIRHYLNIAHNVYLFRQFNPHYEFAPDSDLIVHLLVLKEGWQSLYADVMRETLRRRGATLRELIDSIAAQQELTPEQKRFLSNYLGENSPFREEYLSEWLVKHPTLT